MPNACLRRRRHQYGHRCEPAGFNACWVAVLRHYGWSEPAITFGYTQRIADVRAGSRYRPDSLSPDYGRWHRRSPQRLDLHPGHQRPSVHRQRACDRPLSQAAQGHSTARSRAAGAAHWRLARKPAAPRIPQAPAAPRTPPPADQCFVQAAANDVLNVTGAKIAGAAMKRTRAGLLIQGSIDRAALPETLDFNGFGQGTAQLCRSTRDPHRPQRRPARAL